MTHVLFPKARACAGSACASDYEIDKLVGGVLSREVALQVRERIQGCAGCTARLEVIESEQQLFATRAFPQVADRRTPTRKRWVYGAGSVGGVLAVAALALLMLRPPHPAQDDITRSKGADSVGFLIVGAHGEVLGDEARPVAHPGDELQWQVRVASPRYVAVLSRDATGASNIYFPSDKTTVLMAPGAVAANATRLDAVTGPETLYALICEAPVDLEPLRRELQLRGALTKPAACEMRVSLLRKEP